MMMLYLKSSYRSFLRLFHTAKSVIIGFIKFILFKPIQFISTTESAFFEYRWVEVLALHFSTRN